MRPFRLTIRTRDHVLVSIDDFQIEKDTITVLFGESGIGKTLIAQAVFGLLDPYELHITINGKPYLSYIRSRPVRLLQTDGFFVFQEPSTHLNPLMTLQEQLQEGRLGQSREQKEILQALWKESYETHIRPLLQVYPKPNRPSGGEKQRILLAMAFAKWSLPRKSPERLFVFDEPTGSLDNAYRNIFLRELLQRYERNPFTVLLITHDYSMISEFTEQHRAFLPHIRFKELRRIKEAQVQIFNFQPQKYTKWLKGQKTIATERKPSSREIVLKIEPFFKVFGQTFRLTRTLKNSKAEKLVVHKQEIVYLKAPSGMGKTTLAKIIAGLQPPEQIQFELAGLKLNAATPIRIWRKYIWGKKLAMVFQHADEALNLQANVRDVFKGLPGLSFKHSQELVAALGEIFDSSISKEFLNRKVGHLSGGQKQRLNLLRALLLHPDLIILDEPLNGLDFESIRKVIEIIERKMAAGSGVLLISHNEEIFDRIVPENNHYYLTKVKT